MPKMLDKSSALRLSFKILFRNPVLFLPKLIVAILYGFGVLWSLSLVQKILPLFFWASSAAVLAPALQGLLGAAVLVAVVSAAAFFLDIIFSGLYPPLVGQAIKGRVSFGKALASVKKKLGLILYSGIISWLIVGAVSLLLSGILFALNLSEISWVISFAVAFGFIFFFYFLFPTAIYKDDAVASSFRDTVRESFANSGVVIVYSLVPFAISVVKFVVAFFASGGGGIVLYWALVFLTAVVYSVHAVLTQILFSRLCLGKNP